LLGNGFGRSLTSSFSYDSLFARVAHHLSKTANQIFAAFATTDFEQVLRAVDHAEVVNRAHGLSVDFEATRDEIRKGLIDAVLAVHPAKPSDLDPKWKARALDLLHPFERIFTTNYDLLLYWLLMSSSRDYCDGFGNKQTGELRFENNFPYEHQYFYLHGALHLFTAQDAVRKVKATRKSLPETLAETMAASNYPLFISEGTHESKRRRIDSSPYLRHALEQLSQSKGALVTFGLAFSDNDLHIAAALRDAPELERLFVGVFGSAPADVDRLSKVFAGTKRADVRFFDTQGVL